MGVPDLSKSYYFGVGGYSRRHQKGPKHVKIRPDGIIDGGVCDEAHSRRAARERGALWMLDEFSRLKCIKYEEKRMKVVGSPSLTMQHFQDACKGSSYSADFQIGAYRAAQYLGKIRGRWLTTKHVKRVLQGNQANESQLGGKPHQDGLYRQRRRSGEFKSVGDI